MMSMRQNQPTVPPPGASVSAPSNFAYTGTWSYLEELDCRFVWNDRGNFVLPHPEAWTELGQAMYRMGNGCGRCTRLATLLQTKPRVQAISSRVASIQALSEGHRAWRRYRRTRPAPHRVAWSPCIWEATESGFFRYMEYALRCRDLEVTVRGSYRELEVRRRGGRRDTRVTFVPTSVGNCRVGFHPTSQCGTSTTAGYIYCSYGTVKPLDNGIDTVVDLLEIVSFATLLNERQEADSRGPEPT
jgi:hypothetical protein